MKVGQLVMKIGMDNIQTSLKIPVGTVGEVIKASKEVWEGYTAVYFPAYPTKAACQGCQVKTSLLVPISDPDADVSETEEETIEDFV